MVSINSTSEEVRSFFSHITDVGFLVSINSTSEEVRSRQQRESGTNHFRKFPLIQLPRKSEVPRDNEHPGGVHPVSINSTSEEVRSTASKLLQLCTCGFPLIQLPRKSEATEQGFLPAIAWQFPLIQLPRKSEEMSLPWQWQSWRVSINSTSEEVRRSLLLLVCLLSWLVSINSTSEEVRSGGVGGWIVGIFVSINSTSEEVRSCHFPRPRTGNQACFH